MKKSFDEIFVKLDQIGIIVPEENSKEIRENVIRFFQLDEKTDVLDCGLLRLTNTFYRGLLQNPPPGVDIVCCNKDSLPVELEFLSPVDGNSAWMDYYKKVSRGIHHIRFNVSSHEDAVAYMKEHGIEIYHTGDSSKGPGVKFAYFDSYDKLGFYIETLNLAEMGL